jgi:hypothetical protein
MSRLPKHITRIPARRLYFNYYGALTMSLSIIVLTQAERGFATSRLCVVTDEDGTILAHILHGSDWYIEKGGERSAGSG